MALSTCPDCNHEVSSQAKSCPRCGCPFQEGRRTSRGGTGGALLKILAAVGVVALLGVAFLIWIGLQGVSRQSKEEGLVATAGKAPTLSRAIGIARSELKDGHVLRSEGGLAIANWLLVRTWEMVGDERYQIGSERASGRSPWKQLTYLQPTTFVRATRDIQANRGRMICVYGRVIEVEAIRVGEAQAKVGYEGGLMLSGGGVLRFFTAAPVDAGGNETFCGVVVGRFEYKNTGGGTTKALTAVGMWHSPGANWGAPHECSAPGCIRSASKRGRQCNECANGRLPLIPEGS